MHKVVVERPRSNHWPAKKNRRANLSDELLPKFEGIGRLHGNRKCFTDLLGPLRRWLQSQVGRLWDDVYSEACAVIKPDSVVRAHIKTHLLEFVQRHTFIKEEQIWCFDQRCSWSSVRELPLSQAVNRWTPFYIHPLTKTLCRAEMPAHKPRRDKTVERLKQTMRWLDETTVLRRLQNLWFECRVEKFPHWHITGDTPWRFDMAEKRATNRSEAYATYGRTVFCVSKRQLSRRELVRLGLSNNKSAERSLQPAGQ